MRHFRVISLIFCAAIFVVAGLQTSAYSQKKGNERTISLNRGNNGRLNNAGYWSGRRDNDRQKKVSYRKDHGVRDHGHGIGNGKGQGKGQGWWRRNHKENNHRVKHENRKRDHKRSHRVYYKRRHR